jgi:hypothetical protein
LRQAEFAYFTSHIELFNFAQVHTSERFKFTEKCGRQRDIDMGYLIPPPIGHLRLNPGSQESIRIVEGILSVTSNYSPQTPLFRLL